MNPLRKSIKGIVLLSAIIMILSSFTGLSAQGPDDQGAGVKGGGGEKETPKKKKGTSPFEAGMIIVKDKSLADIESAGTTTEVTEQEMKDRGDKTLDQALQMVPGLNVYQNRKGGMVFDARGVGHSRFAILVDGIPLEEVYGGGGGDVSRIPIMNASKVIVTRGVTSALYGTGGTFGAINVVSKRPEELYAEANAEYGLYDNWSINAATGAPMGKAYFWLSGMVLHSGGYEVSNKLTTNTRRKWFDRFVQYGIYGKTYDDVTLTNKYNYIYDDGRWNNTNYTKYQLQGKIGYEISKNTEVGITAYYYHNRQDFNYFQPNSLTIYKDQSSKYIQPTDPGAYTTSDKGGIIINNAWIWPEDYNYLVSPYFNGEFGELTVKANAFFQQQYNSLDPYANQERTYMSFYSSTYNPAGTPGQNAYSENIRSIYLDTMTGFNIYPSYKIAKWNKLSAGILFNYQIHKEYEKALDASSVNVIAWHGTGNYVTREMDMLNFTIAVEDEMKFDTSAGEISIVAGVSYDMQDLMKYRKRNNDPALGSVNAMIDGYKPNSDSYIMGTRDSFNPVLGVVYDPIDGLLRIRTAFSRKTEFPSMSVYGTNDNALVDIGIDPEISYNFNAGIEVILLEGALNIRSDYFLTKFVDKIEKIYDPVLKTKLYVNIDGVTSQGLEVSISGEKKKIFDIVDLNLMVSYTYLNSKNDFESSSVYGERLERVPMHQYLCQLTMKFFTGTSFIFWGNHMRNQILYTMASVPSTAVQPYTNDYYRRTRLHDPVMLNIKIAQTIPVLDERFSVYFMVKNLLDDYNADPFNPGAGRNFYFGGSGKL